MIRHFTLSILALATAATLPAQTAQTAHTAPRRSTPAPLSASSRAELDDLRAALEAALDRDSGTVPRRFTSSGGHAYRLKGYGAVIVLAPRTLPGGRVVLRTHVGPMRISPRGVAAGAARHVVVTGDGQAVAVQALDLTDFEHEMAAQMAAQAAVLRAMEADQHAWTPATEEQMRVHLREVDEQAEAFRVEAERARRRAELAVRTALAPRIPPVPPAPPDVPQAPEAPDAPEAPEPPPPPPWRFWLDVPEPPDTGDAPDPAKSLETARTVLETGLESYRRPLASLGPEEFVTVAVDFVTGFVRPAPPRTLLLRVRARDLKDHQAGRLSAEALRQRIEIEEED
jgi:hypothetical protein